MRNKSKLPFFAVVLLIVSAVDSNRNLPSAAIFGSPLIFFFLFSAFVFLFPVSMVSAELGAASATKGGIYHWVRLAFGEKPGVIAIWLQWVQAIAWFPTILSFLAGTGAFLIQPDLMYNKTYMIISISGIFWFLTIVNLFGISISSRLNEIFCTIGTIIPTIVLVVLGCIWILHREPLAIPVSLASSIPSFKDFAPWTALVAVITSFTGMELAGVHITSIQNPRKFFPKALMISSFIVLISMLLGALSIAIVLPSKSIHLAGGLMQVFAAFFHKFHLDAWIFVMSLLIVLGSLGSLINWILSPAKGLLHVSEYGYLPTYFSRLNKRGVASRILIAQAVIVSLLCMLFLFLPSVNAFYWFLMSISSCLYMVMYIMMFFAAIRLRPKLPEKAYHIPLGRFGLYSICGLGLIGSIITIIVGFIPPPGIPIATPIKYAIMIGCGNIVMIGPVFLLFLLKRKKKIP